MISALLAIALQATPSCEDSALHRQFDFWVGAWNVYAPTGQFGGQNTIEAQANGCVLHEHWIGASGVSGHSLNFVDIKTGQWRQLWVGPGNQIDYSGGLNERGQMVLTGQIIYERGETDLTLDFRGAWTPLPNGHVIQHFQQFDPDEDQWVNWALLRYVPAETDPNGVEPDSDATAPEISEAPEAFD